MTLICELIRGFESMQRVYEITETEKVITMADTVQFEDGWLNYEGQKARELFMERVRREPNVFGLDSSLQPVQQTSVSNNSGPSKATSELN